MWRIALPLLLATEMPPAPGADPAMPPPALEVGDATTTAVARRVMTGAGALLFAAGAAGGVVLGASLATVAGGFGAVAHFQRQSSLRTDDRAALERASQGALAGSAVGVAGLLGTAASGLLAVVGLGVGGALLVGARLDP